MAILIFPGERIADADGAPISGAKVRVYTANTTDLAPLFSDVDLSSAISNPVVTDAAGYPANGGNECGVYCAAGLYDVAFLDDDDNVLASWDDVSPYGGESGDIDRTVAGNGRFKATGSAGTVRLEFGDPDPDNSGGTVAFTGWANTQGDAATFKFNSLNVEDGRLKEGGKKIAATVQTEATPFSGTATVDIALPNAPTGVRRWRVTIYDLVLATASQPRLRLSYAASLKSGASDYAYAVYYYDPGTSADVRGSDDAAAQIDLHGQNLNGSGTIGTDKVGVIELDIITPDSGSVATLVRFRTAGYTTEATAIPLEATGVGYGLGGYGRADSIRLLNAGGVNMSGRYTVEAIAGTGDA